MDIYEVMEILGEGSMGSVSRVRKRPDAVGGSARAAFVQKHSSRGSLCSMDKCCFGLFQWIQLPGQKNAFVESSRTDISMSNDSTMSNPPPSSSDGASSDNNHRFYRKQSSLVKYEKHKKDNFYALKSIHLDRCSSQEYVDELKVSVHHH
jgi:hypothetical protein